METQPIIRSRDNPLLKELRKLAQDNTAYRKSGRFWIEGDHLCRAALLKGLQPAITITCESFVGKDQEDLIASAAKVVILSDNLFQEISALESPSNMGFVMELPMDAPIQAAESTVILDRVQDAGNVGSILRSAAAFGFKQIVALRGTAALWSPKVLRSGMGAHFGLRLHEGVDVIDLDALQIPLLVTSSHLGQWIQDLQLPFPCAWAMGHEGQGVCQELLDRSALQVRIGQPGGEESLNVAAAAAICLHASALRAPT